MKTNPKRRFRILNVLTESSGIKDGDKLLTFTELVDIINELNEDYENLKWEHHKLKADYEVMEHDYSDLKSELKLKQENNLIRFELDDYPDIELDDFSEFIETNIFKIPANYNLFKGKYDAIFTLFRDRKRNALSINAHIEDYSKK
ncbi:MAG: hypothetical protein IJH63_10430 [Methanobrevibacter sp.]|nr:hypothetical protein [Methanosphaera sp.]MBR0371116.1 hypothetical protein [Methanobrevibacter sp.]